MLIFALPFHNMSGASQAILAITRSKMINMPECIRTDHKEMQRFPCHKATIR